MKIPRLLNNKTDKKLNHNMKKALIIYFLLFIFSTLQQNGYAQQNQIKAGYKISIKLNHYNENVLYLVAYSGGEPFLLDSAFSNKGVYTFSNKKSVLLSGIYSIQNSSLSKSI
jgi:hypothetical protein